MTTPDISVYRAVHHALRGGAHALARAASELDPADHRRVKAFSRYWAGYAGEVLEHHKVEDQVFFPALVRRVPVAAALIERTDADHHHLDELMAAVARGLGAVAAGSDQLAAALAALAAHMDEHLGFEDADILPLFVRHFEADEYRELDAQAKKLLGIGKQAAFTVPFIGLAADPVERAQLLADAPVPFRILYRVTKGRHARLAQMALGSASGMRTTTPEAVR